MRKSLFVLSMMLAIFSVASAEWWDTAKGEALEKAKSLIEDKLKESVSANEGKTVETTKTPGSLAVTNWTDQYIEVTAIATADVNKAQSYAHALSLAEGAARKICQNKLLEQIGGVNVSSMYVLEDEMIKNSAIKTTAEGMLVGAREVSVTHEKLEDGSVLCTMTMGLLLTTNTGVMKLGTMVTQSEKAPNLENYSPATVPPPDKNYSGVVIDASSFDVVPALMVNLVTEDGKVIYGAQTMNKDVLVNEGTSSYARSIKQAKKRAGEEPLIVQALRLVGETACDIVLPQPIADLLIGLNKSNGVLDQGKVVIMTR